MYFPCRFLLAEILDDMLDLVSYWVDQEVEWKLLMGVDPALLDQAYYIRSCQTMMVEHIRSCRTATRLRSYAN